VCVDRKNGRGYWFKEAETPSCDVVNAGMCLTGVRNEAVACFYNRKADVAVCVSHLLFFRLFKPFSVQRFVDRTDETRREMTKEYWKKCSLRGAS